MSVLFQKKNPFFLHRSLLKLSLLVYSLLLFGCHTSLNKATTPKNTVIRILNTSIEPFLLPFKDTCYDTVATKRIILPDSLEKFKGYGRVLGKISDNQKYIAILYAIPADVQLPVLYTFDSAGKKISSLRLYIGNCCGENEDCSGASTVEITKDLRIILKDSIQTFERDKKNADKKRNIQTLKKHQEFRIDSTGRILKVN